MNQIFRHSVASFEPTASGVIIWTRLTGSSRVRWFVAADPDFSDVVATGHAVTGSRDDYTIAVDVDGLQPATTYWYRFESDGEASPIGRTRTLPAAPATSLRIGLVSCACHSVAPLGVYRALAEREVDLVIHLGDYIYENDGAKGTREHRPPRMAVTLDDYRERMAQQREDPDCQALHLRHPMIVVVDDHDIADDFWKDGAKSHDADRDGTWSDRVRAASKARSEWTPARLRDPADLTSTWRSVEIADLAELVILDTRLAGRDLQAGNEGAKPLDDPDRSLLGDTQREWLRRRLAENDRPWSLVVTGVVVNEVTLPLPATSLLNRILPTGYAAIEGKVMHDDQWDGYPAERERLAGWLRERGMAGRRTAILSGDIHSSWAFEGPKRADGGVGDVPVAVEFTTPAVASKPMGRSHLPGAWRLLDALVRSLEHVPWVDVSERGYGLLEVTPAELRMEWWHLEATDDDPGASAHLGAAFVTEHSSWPPRLSESTAAQDPVRPGLPEPLPPRPPDLPKLRRIHHQRQFLARAGGVAISIAVVLSAGRLLKATRRHRDG